MLGLSFISTESPLPSNKYEEPSCALLSKTKLPNFSPWFPLPELSSTPSAGLSLNFHQPLRLDSIPKNLYLSEYEAFSTFISLSDNFLLKNETSSIEPID